MTKIRCIIRQRIDCNSSLIGEGGGKGGAGGLVMGVGLGSLHRYSRINQS